MTDLQLEELRTRDAKDEIVYSKYVRLRSGWKQEKIWQTRGRSFRTTVEWVGQPTPLSYSQATIDVWHIKNEQWNTIAHWQREELSVGMLAQMPSPPILSDIQRAAFDSDAVALIYHATKIVFQRHVR